MMKKNVLYYTKRIGTYDFELNVALKDIEDLKNFMSSLRIEFGDKIDSYSALLINKILKLNYAPF